MDRDRRALADNARRVAAQFPATRLTTLEADFRTPLDLPQLDGLVAANSLHFVARARQAEVLRALASRVRPGGSLLVVEYDADHGNPWVPHPFSSRRWTALAAEAGLADARILGRVPSRFLGAIYSAAALRP